MFRILILISIVCGHVHAAEAPSAFTFQGWKEQQVLDAQNQVLRVSSRLAQLRKDKPTAASKEPSTPLPSSKFKKSEGDSIASVEKDLKRAQESLRAAGELTLDEYVAIYLNGLREHPDVLQAVTQKMTKEEMGEIFKILVRREPTPDTKRNASPLSEGLSAAVRSKSL